MLAAPDRELFAACTPALMAAVCGKSGDDAAKASCLVSRSAAFGKLRSPRTRRSWLLANGCPQGTIDAPPKPPEVVAATEPEAEPRPGPAEPPTEPTEPKPPDSPAAVTESEPPEPAAAPTDPKRTESAATTAEPKPPEPAATPTAQKAPEPAAVPVEPKPPKSAAGPAEHPPEPVAAPIEPKRPDSDRATTTTSANTPAPPKTVRTAPPKLRQRALDDVDLAFEATALSSPPPARPSVTAPAKPPGPARSMRPRITATGRLTLPPPPTLRLPPPPKPTLPPLPKLRASVAAIGGPSPTPAKPVPPSPPDPPTATTIVPFAPGARPTGPPARAFAHKESPEAREQRLRNIVIAHREEMKTCVDRQLKLKPDLRAEGTLIIDVDAAGSVPYAELLGADLTGTPLEDCLRTIASRWRFPSSGRAYRINAPVRVQGSEPGR
jgi:hypothetical protein